MAIGRRQNYAAALVSANGSNTFKTDKKYKVERICFFANEAIASILAEKVQIEVEGELLYSGLSVPIAAIASPEDHAYLDTAVATGRWCLEFETPVTFSTRYPIKVTLSSTEAWYVILEGPQGSGVRDD